MPFQKEISDKLHSVYPHIFDELASPVRRMSVDMELRSGRKLGSVEQYSRALSPIIPYYQGEISGYAFCPEISNDTSKFVFIKGEK